MPFRVPVLGFRTAILAALLLFVNVALSAVLVLVHRSGVETAHETAHALFEQTGLRVQESVQSRMRQVLDAADVIATDDDLIHPLAGDAFDHPAFALMGTLHRLNPGLYSTYVGYDDGSFVQSIAVRDRASVQETLKAPEGTVEARRIISEANGTRTQRWWFLDEDGAVLGSRIEPDPAYDPRQRPWYGSAAAAEGALLSEPYMFNSMPKPGITASRRLPGGGGVAGVDVAVDDLNALAAQQHVSERGRVILADAKGRILGAADDVRGNAPDLAPLTQIDHPLVRQADDDILSSSTRWQGGGTEIIVTILAPLDDFTAFARRVDTTVIILILVVQVLTIPLGFWLANALGRTIDDLATDAERVREMDFTGEIPTPPPIRELRLLAEGFRQMKAQVMERTKNLGQSQETLRRLVELGISLGTERNPGRLAETALAEALRLTQAEGGTLYIRSNDKRLRLAIIRNTPLGLTVGGAGGEAMDLPELDLWDEADGTPIRDNVIADCFHGGLVIDIADVGTWTRHDMTGVQDFDRVTGYQTRSMLVIPLRPPSGEVVGILQLINLTNASAVRRHVQALAGQVAAALHNRILEKSQEGLIDGMVGVVAAAIDAKSPYTGDHAGRLTELALMLADEAGNSDLPAFAGFAALSPGDRRELRTAALLHDCGKVTTPEFVVDKATKLETIHNRIHEIRTRFEVLWRDAELAQARGEITAEALDARKAELNEDFAFIARCNIGGELMSADDALRVRRIAGQSLVRHFDDRLGLSIEEMRHLADIPPVSPPVPETLLADRPEHRIPWTGKERFLEADWKFSLTVPKVMYDRGEVHNLCVSRGTLSPEERFKINEHAIQSIIMLESLPFPPHLARVPEIAGAHHETLTGRGYPRGLSKEQLSIPARILSIADVFEALTAADRPYKTPKTLSQALDIMAGLSRSGHIDADLFALFLSTGVYKRYADTYLPPEQVDEVDVAVYLDEGRVGQ